MTSEHWTVDIAEDGSVKVEGHGFKGRTCQLPPDLMAQLGAVTASRLKPEAFQNAEVKDRVRTGAGGR